VGETDFTGFLEEQTAACYLEGGSALLARVAAVLPFGILMERLRS
jgi:hypothetical protein